MKKLSLELLRLKSLGNGVTSITDHCCNLQLSGDGELCIGLMHSGKQPINFHVAVFKPSYSRNEYLDFDIRDIIQNDSVYLPPSADERLAVIVELIESLFSTEHDLLSGILKQTQGETI